MTMNIAVFISGTGSNLKAIIKYIQSNNLPISIKAVISDQPNAYGLTIAKLNGINTYVVPFKKLSITQDLLDVLEVSAPLGIDYIILAGYMRILPASFVNYPKYKNKILNIHPSLLPKYPGLNTHQKVIDNKDTEHGCTIHIVTAELDNGPILAQAKCFVTPRDTADTLKAKVQKLEHALYPKVIENLLKPELNYHI